MFINDSYNTMSIAIERDVTVMFTWFVQLQQTHLWFFGSESCAIGWNINISYSWRFINKFCLNDYISDLIEFYPQYSTNWKNKIDIYGSVIEL